MLPISLVVRTVVLSLSVLAAGTPALQGQSPQDRFYHAYYLEHAKRDVAAAAKLYGQVVAAREVDANLHAEAKTRLAVCREELASADFTRLMPPDPLGYLEINRPGERLRKLIDQLGLLAEGDGPPTLRENRLAISPAVIDAILGIRGLAVAVTGFDPMAQKPSGVAVLHPGDLELVRGLIETALPVSSNVVDPIRGYATYEIEGFFVTLTRRLVIAGSSEAEIEGVIDRMKSPDEESLATNEELAGVLQDRGDALLFFCVNPKPLMPLVNAMMAGAVLQSRELALAQALLDIPSFRALSGRFDVSDQGVLLELALRLDEGHRNLVYNFLRRPALDPETLRCVPQGAAGFLAMALNDAPADYPDQPPARGDAPPIVTALDIGREIFANINGVAFYALRPVGPHTQAGGGLPNLAAVITVNDPSKSQALWYQMLGIASVATGAPTMEGTTHEVAGVPVRSYRFDPDVTVHVATLGHDLFITSTEAALERSIQAKRSGKSILQDPAFANSLDQLGPHTTIALVAHPARCAEIAKPFMSPGEVREMEPVVALMTDTVAALMVDHSDQTLRLSAVVTGIPDVSGLVSKMLAEQRRGGRARQQVAGALPQKKRDKALDLLDKQLATDPDSTETLESKFDILAVHKKDHAAGLALAEKLFKQMHNDARALNNFAWALLTEDKYGQKYNDVALRFARRSNQMTDQSVWAYVDTLALAEFLTGNARQAVELEEKAIELCERAGGGGMAELRKALARFRAAVQDE